MNIIFKSFSSIPFSFQFYQFLPHPNSWPFLLYLLQQLLSFLMLLMCTCVQSGSFSVSAAALGLLSDPLLSWCLPRLCINLASFWNLGSLRCRCCVASKESSKFCGSQLASFPNCCLTLTATKLDTLRGSEGSTRWARVADRAAARSRSPTIVSASNSKKQSFVEGRIFGGIYGSHNGTY